MWTFKEALHRVILLTAATALTACHSGGSLSLENPVRAVSSQGSPYVSLNSGGQAQLVESGKTATTGVHGWVSVQPIVSQQMTSSNGSGTKLILNKTKMQ